MKREAEEPLKIHEAMDNLSVITEFDLENPVRLGVVKGHKLILEDDEETYESVRWLTNESSPELLDHIKATFTAILHYLKDVYEQKDFDWSDSRTRKGIQSIMVLVGEAANKLDELVAEMENQRGIKPITDSKEYKALQDFYLNKIGEKFDVSLEGDAAWAQEWLKNDDALLLDTEKRGLQDFETVLRDREYELFYIRNDDGRPFFTPDLLKNIKLVCDFDQSADVPLEEDPLLRLRTVEDRDLHGASQVILQHSMPVIEEFYQNIKKSESQDLMRALNKAVMALMLASNPKNLLQNTLLKSCYQYFGDFLLFLKEAIHSDQYQYLIAYPPEPTDRVSMCLLDLVHTLCHQYFFRMHGIKQEMIGLIHRINRKGEEIRKKRKEKFTAESIWEEFIQEDENIQTLLKCYPNGPIFKVLDLLRKEDQHGENIEFNPLSQENFPCHLFYLHYAKSDISVIRLPCPIKQKIISKAEIVELFRCLMRAYSTQSPKKRHLLFNLQDRTSWKDLARCQAIEGMQKQAEFGAQLYVISLNKDTDFYYQTDVYLQMDDAKEFMEILREQMFQAEECGYYFPKIFYTPEFTKFLDDLIPTIHDTFFGKAKKLSRKERLDFIEIFYHFIYLKSIEIVEPDSLSFTCKDAIDTGACASACFFSFVRLITKGKLTDDDRNLIRWLLYTAALRVRDRSVDAQRLNRVISALDRIDSHRGKKLDKALTTLLKEVKDIDIK